MMLTCIGLRFLCCAINKSKISYVSHLGKIEWMPHDIMVRVCFCDREQKHPKGLRLLDCTDAAGSGIAHRNFNRETL